MVAPVAPVGHPYTWRVKKYYSSHPQSYEIHLFTIFLRSTFEKLFCLYHFLSFATMHCSERLTVPSSTKIKCQGNRPVDRWRLDTSFQQGMRRSISVTPATSKAQHLSVLIGIFSFHLVYNRPMLLSSFNNRKIEVSGTTKEQYDKKCYIRRKRYDNKGHINLANN